MHFYIYTNKYMDIEINIYGNVWDVLIRVSPSANIVNLCFICFIERNHDK